MRAEDFFPLGWGERKFRKPPYPDMTYTEAMDTAMVTFWDGVGGPDAALLHRNLQVIKWELKNEHPDFPGRSRLNVKDFNNFWRGRVTTLLTWFKKQEGK